MDTRKKIYKGFTDATKVVCRNCGNPYPRLAMPWRCPDCEGVFTIRSLSYSPEFPSKTRQPGIWKYRGVFPLEENAFSISLGEGNTPLVPMQVHGVRVWCKLESLNPTASFKDRGTAVLAAAMIERGIRSAVEDSSGNAGASFAAYCARGGILARVYIPDSAAGPKRRQIESYGAEVVAVPGTRSEAVREVRREADRGAVYASHAFLPHGLAGIATAAFEIVEQLDEAPAVVIAPAGHGNLLTGLWLGFQALFSAGEITNMPRMIAVQAEACAPIWLEHTGATESLSVEGITIADGISVLHPVRAAEVLEAVRSTSGWVAAVSEEAIQEGRRRFAQVGFFVENTSAAVWPVLEGLVQSLSDRQDHAEEKIAGPIVAILSGHGLKTP